jgi:hypothetical protein
MVMTILFTAEGHFREGSIGKKWEFEMELGRIILTEQELNLMKKSNISLTDIGTPVDNYQEGYKIPLSEIKKAYSIKNRKIYTVILETRDNHMFTITMAGYGNPGRLECFKLSELINSAILSNIKVNEPGSVKPDTITFNSGFIICEQCGEKNAFGVNFCKNCGNKMS